MSASVYQGESRAIPRWTLAVVVIALVLVQAWILGTVPSTQGATSAPAILTWLIHRPVLDVAAAVLAVAGLVQFARRRSALAWGSVGFLTFGVMCESQTVLTGRTEHIFLIPAAVLFGWLCGLAYARALRGHLPAPLGAAQAREMDDELGEAGAAGGFAATYLCAAASKLIASGGHWTDPQEVLGAIVTRHLVGGGGFRDFYLHAFLRWPELVRVSAIGTLIIEGGAFLYLTRPRLRMLWGALIFLFHLNTYVLMDVKYPPPMILAVAFSFPWPRMLRSLRGGAAKEAVAETWRTVCTGEVVTAATKQGLGWLRTLTEVVLILWGVTHLRVIASMDNAGYRQPSGTSPAQASNAPEKVFQPGRVQWPPVLPGKTAAAMATAGGPSGPPGTGSAGNGQGTQVGTGQGTQVGTGIGGAPPPPPITDAGRALLGGLKVNDTLGGWQVSRLSGPTQKAIDVMLKNGDRSFVLNITRVGTWTYTTPYMSSQYAVYYGNYTPKDESKFTDIGTACTAMVARLQQTENRVSVPAGM